MSGPPAFRAEVAASLPPGMLLPEPLGDLLDWLAASGHVEPYRSRAGHHAGLYPPGDPAGRRSAVAFHAADPADARTWLDTDDPALAGRLAVIARTGGDGSMAALWRDEAGTTRVVHLGSGSGSVLACLLGDSPLDFLRLLAIGYPEPCWAEQFDRTPAEVAAEDEDDETPFQAPVAFRRWLETRFGVTVPRTGAEVVPVPAFLGDTASPEPVQSLAGRGAGLVSLAAVLLVLVTIPGGADDRRHPHWLAGTWDVHGPADPRTGDCATGTDQVEYHRDGTWRGVAVGDAGRWWVSHGRLVELTLRPGAGGDVRDTGSRTSRALRHVGRDEARLSGPQGSSRMVRCRSGR